MPASPSRRPLGDDGLPAQPPNVDIVRRLARAWQFRIETGSHADVLLSKWGLLPSDVRHCILNGRCDEYEEDEQSKAWDGWKYIFTGPSEQGEVQIEMYVVVKIRGHEQPERLFIITAHAQAQG